MLILSRKLGESIVIGEDVSVTILGITGGQIRIGIDAPKHVAVHREEIFQKINSGQGRPKRQIDDRRSKHSHSPAA